SSSTASPVFINRRTSVSAESMVFSQGWKPPVFPKSADQTSRLEKSVSDNFIFRALREDSLKLVIQALEEVPHDKTAAGCVIVKQGDHGDYFYIVESGDLRVIIDGVQVGTVGPSGSFGELALLHNAPRAATVEAITDTVLWRLDRVTFRRILFEGTSKRRALYESFLKEVPVLSVLKDYELLRLADALDSRTYAPGEIIVKEGDAGDAFFIIESGDAEVIKEGSGKVQDLHKGDYFGELALLYDQPRAATVKAVTKVTVATLKKNGFQRLLGPVVDVLRERAP
ncbi:hypothetical protein CANCADRAFT_15843, partial [Tortispora caseinolytica NRRL Y-17796]